MLVFLSTALFLSHFFICALAGPGSARFKIKQIASARTTGTLSPRQAIQDVPSQCKSTCDPVVNSIANNQCTVQACCSDSFETGYYNCLLCVGKALGVTDFSAGQSVLNLLQSTCASRGISIPTLVLPGQGAGTTSGAATTSPRPSTNASPSSSTTRTSAQTSRPVSSASSSSGPSVLPTPTSITQQTVTSVSGTTTPTASNTAPAPQQTNNNGASIVLGGSGLLPIAVLLNFVFILMGDHI